LGPLYIENGGQGGESSSWREFSSGSYFFLKGASFQAGSPLPVAVNLVRYEMGSGVNVEDLNVSLRQCLNN